MPEPSDPIVSANLKDLPAYPCGNCPEFTLSDQVMARVDEILAAVDVSAELR